MAAAYSSLRGAKHLHETLLGIEMRATDTKLAAPFIFAELEAGEEGLFQRLGGRFVNTGRTRDSLTTAAPSKDAIREVTPFSFRFGTRVWYAVFLKKDSTPGQTAKGMMNKRSAVLISNIVATRVAGRALLTYVRYGLENKSALEHLVGL
jgi:hypothetical protein